MCIDDLEGVVLLDELEWFAPAVASMKVEVDDTGESEVPVQGALNSSHPSERVSYLAALVDILHFLSTATYACVAEHKGEIVGVALAEVFGGAPMFPQAQALKAKARTDLVALPGGARLLEVGEESLAVNAELAGEARGECQGEWQLFLVAKEYRGHGIGGQLWRGVRKYFRDAKVERYYLFTDTTCDWQIYENHGMRRAAQQAATADIAGTMTDKFIYVGRP